MKALEELKKVEELTIDGYLSQMMFIHGVKDKRDKKYSSLKTTVSNFMKPKKISVKAPEEEKEKVSTQIPLFELSSDESEEPKEKVET